MKTKLGILGNISTRRLWLMAIATALTVGTHAPRCLGGQSNQTDQAATSSSVPWQDNQIIKPEDLAKSLSDATGQKPLVICVGFQVLYQGGHIVGAKFAGPAARPAGLQALKRQVQGLPKDKWIVIYCGCCPWQRCPNIRPAFRTLQELGFTNVQVLSLPTNFREDWIAKGLPIEKGPEKQ